MRTRPVAPFGGDPQQVRGRINAGHLGAAGARSLERQARPAGHVEQPDTTGYFEGPVYRVVAVSTQRLLIERPVGRPGPPSVASFLPPHARPSLQQDSPNLAICPRIMRAERRPGPAAHSHETDQMTLPVVWPIPGSVSDCNGHPRAWPTGRSTNRRPAWQQVKLIADTA